MSGNDGVGRGNRPVKVLWDGNLKLAIFRNRREQGVFYSAVPSRIFTDEKTGKPRETNSFGPNDLLRLNRLGHRGYEDILELREQDKQRARDDERERGNDRRDDRNEHDRTEGFRERQKERTSRPRGRNRDREDFGRER